MIAEDLAAEGRSWVERWRLNRGLQAPPLIAATVHDQRGRRITLTAHDIDPPRHPQDRIARGCSMLVVLGTGLQAAKVGTMFDVQIGQETGLLLMTRERDAGAASTAMIPFAVQAQPPSVRWGEAVLGGLTDPPPIVVSAFERAFGERLMDYRRQRQPAGVSDAEWEALDHLSIAEALAAQKWKVRVSGTLQHVSLAERLSRIDDSPLISVRLA